MVLIYSSVLPALLLFVCSTSRLFFGCGYAHTPVLYLPFMLPRPTKHLHVASSSCCVTCMCDRPSAAPLYRYELAYVESTQGVARGQRVWQLAFGSGFKFNSAVLQATRRISDHHSAWDNFDSVVSLLCWIGLGRWWAGRKRVDPRGACASSPPPPP